MFKKNRDFVYVFLFFIIVIIGTISAIIMTPNPLGQALTTSHRTVSTDCCSDTKVCCAVCNHEECEYFCSSNNTCSAGNGSVIPDIYCCGIPF